MPREIAPPLELRFLDTRTGTVLLEEEPPHFLWPGPRHWKAEGGDLWSLDQRFRAWEGERLHGMGQHQHGRLDLKGCVLDLHQRNTEITIPFLMSSRGYGLLWNMPGIGRAELAANRTHFSMEATRQLDYVVVAGHRPAEILSRYTALAGRPPELPDWALGFWQSRLRYASQEEVLAVARGYRRRGLPLDVLVIDFFHWTRMGEWRFRPEEWPDPGAMAAELRAMGVTPMVSVWPTVSANADTYERFVREGWLVESRRGAMDGSIFYDREPDGMNPLRFYDATHPDARAFHWARVREGYAAHGIRAFWLDANEPEMYPMHPENLRLHAGDGRDVANLYPLAHQEGYAEAFAAEGIEDALLLSRSGWAGTQRHPVVLWSGDVKSTFAALRLQVAAGLNVALSGISWWTTDIGGFKGGDVGDPAFRELLVRWFQWGALCPVFRLHGFRRDAARDPRLGHAFSDGGADNEVWSFGPEVEEVLARYLRLRARLRPYLRRLMREAAEIGLPPMRPLLVDFPEDAAVADVADAYMLGPDLLVAPVMEAGATSRPVHLPAGARWRDVWTGEARPPGPQEAQAPLHLIPCFAREGSGLERLFPDPPGGHGAPDG
jgi:alpha-D-xyloside xylohydrolase